jgi:hypothetical protein
MTLARLQEHQFVHRLNYLHYLHDDCLQKFRSAALLVGADLRQWPHIDRFYDRTVNLSPLTGFWDIVCERYNREIFDSQRDFFVDDEPIILFSEFIYHRLWRVLVSNSESEMTRNILRAVMTIPSNDHKFAASALVHHIREMRFNVQMRGYSLTDLE